MCQLFTNRPFTGQNWVAAALFAAAAVISFLSGDKHHVTYGILFALAAVLIAATALGLFGQREGRYGDALRRHRNSPWWVMSLVYGGLFGLLFFIIVLIGAEKLTTALIEGALGGIFFGGIMGPLGAYQMTSPGASDEMNDSLCVGMLTAYPATGPCAHLCALRRHSPTRSKNTPHRFSPPTGAPA